MLNKTIISLLAIATLSGCQTTELADPNYIWFRSNAQLAHFNVKDATNIPASSVSTGSRSLIPRIQNNIDRPNVEKWTLNCNAGDVIIEHLPFRTYSRSDFSNILDEEAFLKRFQKRLPRSNAAYKIEKIDITERLASGHIAYYQDKNGINCQHSLAIMRTRENRIDERDSGFVDTVVDIDYCGEPQLDIQTLLTDLELYSDSRDLARRLETWTPDQCPSIAKDFKFSRPLETSSFAKMSLIWKSTLPLENIIVEFHSNKREGVFTFNNTEKIVCSGSYQSPTDFPVVQGEWSVVCDDGSSAIGQFVTTKAGIINGVGYDANGRVTRFSFKNFVLDRKDLQLSDTTSKT